jgi:hypothetical protein
MWRVRRELAARWFCLRIHLRQCAHHWAFIFNQKFRRGTV